MTTRELAQSISLTIKGVPEMWYDKKAGLFVVGVPHRAEGRERYTLLASSPMKAPCQIIYRALLRASSHRAKPR